MNHSDVVREMKNQLKDKKIETWDRHGHSMAPCINCARVLELVLGKKLKDGASTNEERLASKVVSVDNKDWSGDVVQLSQDSEPKPGAQGGLGLSKRELRDEDDDQDKTEKLHKALLDAQNVPIGARRFARNNGLDYVNDFKLLSEQKRDAADAVEAKLNDAKKEKASKKKIGRLEKELKAAEKDYQSRLKRDAAEIELDKQDENKDGD